MKSTPSCSPVLRSRSAAPRRACTGASLLLLLALSACGGGGGDSGTESGSGGSTVSESTLSGVAAVGAPLGGAQISVIDAQGKTLGQATAHPVEGSYSLKLSGSLSAPLMVQARGVDASGQPQLLHSSVPKAAQAMVAHVTPLTQAVTALALGAEPAGVFAKGSESASTLAGLAQSVAAADFLKTLIKAQFTDLKITDTSKFDLLAEAGFAANKGSHDLLLESLRVGLGRSAQGASELLLANKFLPGAPYEVRIDLALARAELAKTTGAAPANAITSTLKATTSATGVLPNLSQIDELGVALNKLIAQGADAATLQAYAGLASYDKHNGRSKAELAALLAGYASKNWQLGRFYVLGCADDTVSQGNCNRVLVSAPVSDSSGTVVDQFSDALSYNKSAATGVPKWGLIGNGKRLEFRIQPLAWLSLEADGSASSGLSAGNPSQGVQLLVQAQTAAGTALLDKATVQTPGGFSIPLAYCQQRWLCISPTAGASSAVSSGPVADTLLQPAILGWLGSADTLRNAKYLASFTLSGTTEIQPTWLRHELSSTAPAAGRFPVLDGVSASAVLSASSLQAGASLAWSTWAKANPDLRLSLVRTVLVLAGTAGTRVQEFRPAAAVGGSTLSLPAGAYTLPTGSGSAQAYELWLRAQDGAGRIYDTRYRVQP